MYVAVLSVFFAFDGRIDFGWRLFMRVVVGADPYRGIGNFIGFLSCVGARNKIRMVPIRNFSKN